MSPADRTIAAHRLVLTAIPLDVARAILAGDLSAVRPAPGWPHEDTLAGLRGDVARGHDEGTGWFIRLRDGPHEGAVIGDCGWAGGPGPDGTAEIGYGLAGPFRGRRYGAEAVGALVGWALAQPGCTVLVARVLADNRASRRILERHGFGLDRVDGGWLWYATATAVTIGDESGRERERRRAPAAPPAGESGETAS